MGSDSSLDLRYFASKAAKRVRDTLTSDVDAYIRSLEEEQGKIKMFKNELPLCVGLLGELIVLMKAEAGKKTKSDHKVATATEEDGDSGDKSKWMSMAQLWTGNSRRKDEESEKQEKGMSALEATSDGGGAFLPLKAVGSGVPALAPLCLREVDKAMDPRMPDLSLLSPPMMKSAPAADADATKESCRQVMGFTQEVARVVTMASSAPPSSLQSQPQQMAQQQQRQARKSRRTWSPELHRQFVVALKKLGGPQFATPKHIREVMKVDGLTNDEVKSHLQKYRLHNRKALGSAVVSQSSAVSGKSGSPGSKVACSLDLPKAPSTCQPQASPSHRHPPSTVRRKMDGPRAMAGNDEAVVPSSMFKEKKRLAG